MMQQEDKAHDQIPKSDSQKFIDRVERRDKMVKIFEVIILFGLVAFNVFTVIQNQRSALERSAIATQERAETKEYIKCVLLIRFDVPEKELTTREGAEKALDDCAKSSQK